MIRKPTLFFIVLIISPYIYGISYYVAVNGDDSNNGTSVSTPFATLSKALSLVKAGDVIYVRGGTYHFTSSLEISVSGNVTDSCRLMAYPGERPRLDFSGTPLGTRGIKLKGDYWHLKGFDVCKAGDNGIHISGGNNVIEFCRFFENGDSGLQLSNGAHHNAIINCDSYFNADPPDYGDADGFACKMDVGSHNRFYGCRSWLNVDDGWDGYLRGADDVTSSIENCWTWRNGYFKDGTDAGPSANGNGFKMGGSDEKTLKHNVTLKNCIAFDNKSKGFDQNNNRGSMILYHCTGYRNEGKNYSLSQELTGGKIMEVKNCVAVDGKVSIAAFALQLTNSWMESFVVSVDDFVSLDTTGISQSRKPDGSLPDVDFLHLAEGSDLIDGGTDLGFPFLGAAPDPGAFESDQANSIYPAFQDDEEGYFRIRLGRNPVDDLLDIYFEISVADEITWMIWDMQGRTLCTSRRHYPAGPGNVIVPTGDLPAGVYIFGMTANRGVQYIRFVK